MKPWRRIDLRYTLTMQSNFHIGSGADIPGLVDRAVLRLANGELVVPSSTIKGRGRYRTEQVAKALGIYRCGGRARDAALCKPQNQQEAGRNLCLICRLFGSEWQPGTLYFGDARLNSWLRELVYQQPEDPAQAFDYQVSNHTRTRIDRRLRRVMEGALYNFEEGAAGLLFEGRVQGALLCVARDEETALPLEVLTLVAGLQLVDSLGGKKTVGLGACELKVNKLQIDTEILDEPMLNEQLSQYLEEVALYDDYRQQ